MTSSRPLVCSAFFLISSMAFIAMLRFSMADATDRSCVAARCVFIGVHASPACGINPTPAFVPCPPPERVITNAKYDSGAGEATKVPITHRDLTAPTFRAKPFNDPGWVGS